MAEEARTKICCRCHEEKSTTEFFRDNRGYGGGYLSRCKACRPKSGNRDPAKKAEYYRRAGKCTVPYVPRAERERAAALKRAMVEFGRAMSVLALEAYPTLPRAGTKAWYDIATNAQIREFRATRAAEYRERYRRDILGQRSKTKHYKRTHPEIVAKHHAERQQRIEQSDDGTLHPSALAHLFATTTECPYCEATLDHTNATLDHLIPVARGGKHSITNAAVACDDCNTRKGAKTPLEFIWQRFIDGLPFEQYNARPCQRAA